MNIQDVRAFVAVAETGSVNRAAARLNLTQPATTRRIQSFEAAIGDTPLFDRSVKPAVLTAAGHHVLEHCRRVLAAMAELEACASTAADPVGDLKAGVAHGLGEMVMTGPLNALRGRFPGIRLRVSSNWSTNLIEEVRSGALDFAVGLLTDAHGVPPGVLRVSLGAEQVVVVAPVNSPAVSTDAPQSLGDLAGEGWLLNPPGCGCRAALTRAFDRLQRPIQIAAEVFGEDLQLALLAQSGGLGLVPRRQFEQSPHRHALRIVDLADFTLPATVSLIRRAGPARFDAASDLLVDRLRTKLNGETIAA